MYDMLCRQGPSERRSRPWLRENGARRESGGKDSPNGAYRSEGPCRPAMFGRWIISVTDHANMALAKTKKCRMILQQITMSLDRQNRAYKTCQHGTAELFTSSGQGLLIFDPLDNRNPSLLINYQKVSLLEESQEVGMKWGLGRSAWLYADM